MTLRSLGHRAPLLWLVVPFIAGLVLAKLTGNSFVLAPLTLALLCGLGALRASGRGGQSWAPALAVTMALAGAASYALHRVRLPVWDTLPPREAELSLRIDRTFAPSDARRTTGLATVAHAASHLRELVGQRVYFSLALREGEAPPLRRTVLAAIGVLATLPENPPLSSFDGYLAGAGVNFRYTRGRVLGVERPAPAYYRACAGAAAHFHGLLGLGIAGKQPDLAGLLRAIMLGATQELNDEQHDLFRQSGTMHLFAISGLNIGVIAGALQALLLLLRLPAWPRFLIGAALLWLFVDITGASPSAVRAFAMAVFLHAALVLRQPGNVLAGLVLSSFAVMLVAPLQVFSASFLMSYTIVAALLVFGLPLSESWTSGWSPWRDRPKPAWTPWHHGLDLAWRTTAAALAIGLSTTLVSLLTGVQFFQLLTPGSFFTNLILIPAAVVVTLGGFAALLCGLLGFGFGAVLCNHATALVLTFIEAVVRLSVKLPGAFLPAHFSPPWIGPVALLGLLTLLVAGFATGWRQPRGAAWLPFVYLAIILIVGVKFD